MIKHVEDIFRTNEYEELPGHPEEPPVIRLDPFLSDEFAFDKYALQRKIPVGVMVADRKMKVSFAAREIIFEMARKTQSVLNHESLSLSCLNGQLGEDEGPFIRARFASLLSVQN